MSDDAGLPTDFIVAAQIRRAAQEGVPIVVRHRGDGSSGVLILKINLLNGTARVLTQVRYGDRVMWSPVGKSDPMPESDAETYLARQKDIDPDSWILEIEDRRGRVWFEGKVLESRSS